MTHNESGLKACPFCGSHRAVSTTDDAGHHGVKCWGCGVEIVPFAPTKDKAAATWNRRAEVRKRFSFDGNGKTVTR